jgi:formylglycine-generating enzyme required for sulfatase activity
MAGNVWEWVQENNPPDKPLPNGKQWNMGGSFNSDLAEMKCNSERSDYQSGNKDIGFRIVQEIDH